MFKELKYLSYILSIFFSVFFVLKFYMSEINIKRTNKILIQFENELDKKINYLPIIQSDTNDIIEYKNEVDEFINKKPKKWWILIK